MKKFKCWRTNEPNERVEIEAPSYQYAAELFAEDRIERNVDSMLVSVHHSLDGTKEFRVEIEWEPSCLAKELARKGV